MELAVTVLMQVAIMLILIALGYLVGKLKIMNEVGKKQISELLLSVVTPAVLVSAYFREFDASLLVGLLWAMLLAVCSHGLMIFMAFLIARKGRETEQNRLGRFCMIYSNCGFMALPLVESLLGDIGVFYAGAYLIVLNVLSWTHGIVLLTGDAKKVGVKKAVLNPIVISVAIGLVLFFTGIPLPEIITRPIGYVANLNTPLAMLTIGLSLSRLKLGETFTDKRVYAVAAVRILLMPLLMLLLLRFLPLSETVLLVTLIQVSCPTAGSSVMWAARFDMDDSYASKIVAVSTILSVLTIPLMVFLFQLGRA